MTFDDGPGAYTDRLLDALAEHDAYATFFFVGEHVLEHPGPARRAADAGHQVGVHSFTHRNLTTLSPPRTAASLLHGIHRSTVEAVERTLGWLEAHGYTMVTVDELLHPTAGATYGGRV